MTTYLYVKKHVNTGLLYLGVTTKDPYKYLGSGLYWSQHLEKHGKNITTCVLGEYADIEECSKAALEYSALHNVVESSAWANLKPENAKQGWVCGMPQSAESVAKRAAANRGKKRTEETKRKIAETRMGEKHWYYGKPSEEMPWFGRKHTAESIDKMAAAKRGKVYSEETRQKHRIKSAGAGNPAAKCFLATDENGVEYFGKSLSTFSREHGLSPACMRKVALGNQIRHKGWTVQYVQQDQRGAK